MKSPVHIIILILFTFFYLGSFYAQDLNPAYDVFSVNDGLADNRVNEITQDEKGILWIATQNGLSRYDNFNFFNFSIETDSVFFPDNQVDAFCKSKKYILLLSKSYGAIQLDPLIGSFTWLHRRGILSADVSGDSSVFVFSDGNIEFYLKNKKISTKKVGATPFASVLLHNNKIYFSCDKDGVEVINPFSMKTEGIIPSETMEANGRLLHSVKFGLIYHAGKRVFVINSKNELELHPEFKDKFDITFFCENKTGDPNFINHFKTPFVSAYGFYNKIQFNRKLNAQVKSLFVVSENCFFLSTNQGVLKSMFKYNIAKPIDDNYLFNEDLLRLRKGIVEGPDSSVYLLGYPGILRYKNGGLSLIDTSNLITKTGIIINDRLYCITEGSG